MPTWASGAVSCTVSRNSVASTPHAAPVRRACISRCSSASRLRECSGLTAMELPTGMEPPALSPACAPSPGKVCQRSEGQGFCNCQVSSFSKRRCLRPPSRFRRLRERRRSLPANSVSRPLAGGGRGGPANSDKVAGEAPVSEPPNHARTRSASSSSRASKPRSSSTEDRTEGLEQPRCCERLEAPVPPFDRILNKRRLPSGITDLQVLHC